MVVMLKHCCCGCTLKTGTLIIAVVFTILTGLEVVLYSFTAMETTERLYHHQEEWEILEEERLSSTTERLYHQDEWEILEQERLSSTPYPVVDEEGDLVANNDTNRTYRHQYRVPLATRMKFLHVAKWCMILESVTGTISFMLSILLMFAANKDSARHVLIWVFGFFGVTCFRLVLEMILVGVVFHVGVAVAGCILLSVITVETVGEAYCMLVVFSYYRQLVGTGIARRISQQDD